MLEFESILVAGTIMLLPMNLFQILNGEDGVHCVKHHIIALHRFHGSLLIDFCAVFAVAAMPIAIDVANPIQHIF